jgi:hypothetical protein
MDYEHLVALELEVSGRWPWQRAQDAEPHLGGAS